ncbi:hypothetical protein KY285_009094 [Solanum tuberosum]|nr:hypothetical protein KY285_009094 [Solanum tuberosum]
MEGKLSQIQEQLQKLMEGMVNINDRNEQTDKELIEIKQALGNAKQKDNEMDQHRAESFVGGDREQGFTMQLGISKILMVDQFFAMDEVPYDQRVRVASIHLDGEAIAWHRSHLKSRNSIIDPSWSEYVLAVNERFGEEFEDSMEALKNLQQTEDVRTYQAEFDRLLNGVNLSNENAISCFLGGLKTELNKAVRMQAPKTLMQAYKLAKLQEEVFDAQAKSWGIRNSRSQNDLLPTPSRFQGVQKPIFSSTTVKKPYEPNANRFSNGNAGRTLLTAAEMDEKRAKRLCFLCDEKYMPGHVCKSKKQLYLVEVLGMGSAEYQTIRVTGYHEKQPLQVLIDTGSTHNFIDESMARKLGCKALPIHEQSVSVANSRKVQTAAVCKNLKWLLQGITFSSDFLLLPLGNADIVLGVQWLNTLGRILFDFRNRTIEFVHLGRKHVLRGASSQIKTTKAQSLNKKSVDLVQVFMLTLVTDATSDMQCNSIQVTQGTDIHPTLTVLMEQYKCLFDMPCSLPPHRGIFYHKIPHIDSATHVNKRPYRYPGIKKDIIEKLVQEMLDQVKDKLPIPIIEDLLDELGGAEVFSKIDLRAGYHQLRMKETDIYKTAFKTHEGYYEFLEVSTGFFYDILVYSKDMSAHVNHLQAVFELMKQHQLFAKVSKCAFGVPEVEYLGHFISAKGVATDPKKIYAVHAWSVPTNIKQLRGFLGLTGYYRRFILNFGSIAKPLTELLKKDKFVWNEGATTAFHVLKNALVTTPVLALPDYDKLFIIETDARGSGIGAILMQQGHPIAYIRSDNKAADALSRNQSAELLAVSLLTPNDTLLERISLTWTSDAELQAVILKLQAKPYKFYTWIGSQLRWKRRHKYDTSAYPGLIQPLHVPDGVWVDISLDFIEGLPKSKGKDAILVVVDRFRVLLHKSTAYHPQTDGQIKVLNRTLETYLRCFCSDSPHTWATQLPLVEWWYNTTYHSTLKCTPFEVLYGKKPPIHLPYLAGESSNDMVDRSLEAREAVIALLKFHLAKAQQNMRDKANKHRSNRQFMEGDWVYLKLQPYRQISVASRTFNKLAAKYFGPYLLKKCYEVPTIINHPPILHLSSPYCPNPESILERRMVKKGNKAMCQVLVQWSGLDVSQATWEFLYELQHRFSLLVDIILSITVNWINILASKLKALKHKLKEWSRSEQGNLGQQRKSLLEKLTAMENTATDKGLTENEATEKARLLLNLKDLIKNEEIY